MIPIREYVTAHSSVNKKVVEIFVTDARTNNEIDDRPKLVSFPVCTMYDEELQRARAEQYCEFMNKIVRATKDAYEQNALLDILKSDNS